MNPNGLILSISIGLVGNGLSSNFTLLTVGQICHLLRIVKLNEIGYSKGSHGLHITTVLRGYSLLLINKNKWKYAYIMWNIHILYIVSWLIIMIFNWIELITNNILFHRYSCGCSYIWNFWSDRVAGWLEKITWFLIQHPF